MRFACSAEALLGGLNTVTRVLAARSTQPILEGTLILADECGLRLTCSDGMISVLTSVGAAVSEEGAIVLPGRLFLDIIRRMPSDEIQVNVNENGVASFKCQGVRMTIAGQDAKFYPALPLISAENSFTLPQKVLRDMLTATSFAIATDDPRKVLNGCLMEIGRGDARVVALDGFRLALRLERVGEDVPTVSAILPGKSVAEIARILDDDMDKQIEILIGGAQMKAVMGETEFYSTLIEGEYIDYRKILPAGWKTRVKFDRDMMNRCVERCSLIAREGKNNLLRISIGDGGMVITAASETGDAYEELDAEIEGEAISIAFNVNYISDILRVLPEGEAYLRLNSPVSPCVVCPVEGDEYLYLMLPVRVNA